MISRNLMAIAGATLAAALFLTAPASAQTSEEWKLCAREAGTTPDQQISGCTKIIQAGRENTNDLAIAYSNRAWGWQDKGDIAKAFADADQAVKLNPKYATAYLNRGRALSARGEDDKAIADYNEAIKLNPKFAMAYNNRGAKYKDKGDVARALQDYGEAIRIDPNLQLPLSNRGILLSNQGRYDEAIRDFDTLIKLDPNHRTAYFDRGLAYLNKREYDRAIADYDQTIRINPTAASYYNRGLSYRNKGDDNRAIADYTEALRIDPKYAHAYNNRGLIFRGNGEHDRAIADYNEAIRLDPKYTLAYNNRGYAYFTKGDTDRAIPDYDEAIRLDPAYTTALFNRANAYERKNQYERAIPDYDQIIRVQATNVAGWNQRCWARAMAGQLQAALADCNEALRLRPNDANSLENRGFVQLRLNRIDDAIDSYDAVLKVDPKRAFSFYGRGTARTQKGDSNGARADFAAATGLRANIAADFGRFATRSANPETNVAVIPSPQPPQRPSLFTPPPTPLPAIPTDTGRRVALVIGNGAYVNAGALPNPPNDARDVAAALRNLGFEVIEGFDLDGAAMRRKIADFGDKMAGATTTLFFYAGHGMQVAGKNYLVPTDARLERPSSLGVEAIDINVVLSDMESEKRINLVFLDACRDNPLSRSLARSLGATRSSSVGQGLAQLNAGIGTLIAFATSPNDVALDGRGRNSPFTQALLKHIRTPQLEVRSMLTRVRADVIAMTNDKQVPWDHSSLTGEFYFIPK